MYLPDRLMADEICPSMAQGFLSLSRDASRGMCLWAISRRTILKKAGQSTGRSQHVRLTWGLLGADGSEAVAVIDWAGQAC